MSNNQPSLRIGDRERDEAVRLLRQQADEGRLAPAELTERSALVKAARTRNDLGPAFLDLPVDPPTGELGEFMPYPPTTADSQLPAVQSDALGRPIGSSTDRAVEQAEPGRLPTSPKTKRIGTIVMGLLWPAIVAVNFIFGWHLWWLFLVAAFGSGWLAWAFGIADRPNKDDCDD